MIHIHRSNDDKACHQLFVPFLYLNHKLNPYWLANSQPRPRIQSIDYNRPHFCKYKHKYDHNNYFVRITVRRTCRPVITVRQTCRPVGCPNPTERTKRTKKEMNRKKQTRALHPYMYKFKNRIERSIKVKYDTHY